MGLDDPTEKMSKSLAEVREGHAIRLLDPPEKIRRAIMRAKTDSGSTVSAANLSPAIENLLSLYEALRPKCGKPRWRNSISAATACSRTRCSTRCSTSSERFERNMTRSRRTPHISNLVLADGAARAPRPSQNATLQKAKDLVGLIPPR